MSDGAESPSRLIASPDGNPIAVFSSGEGPPLVLVHGATADHTTWRSAGPVLAEMFTIHAIDRRGRGASGDGRTYSIEREYEDLAAVAATLAAEAGRAVDIVGHSYGGRCALGAALLGGDNIRRLVVYEGAPPPSGARAGYRPSGIERRIADLIDAGDRDAALATFMGEIVRMPPAELAAFRADPIWPIRAAAVHTTLRELEGEASPAASLEALATVQVPVLQLLGGESAPIFGEAIRALDARLGDGRVVTIDGARHAAHHTHVAAFVGAVRAFLQPADMAD
ncbi:MAG TPA: alpha/beta hydrolase [Candidatus Limnocylindrales bacterium]|nr:alpha/beta hydrolase [Candidatus Limnocylindrales bacterium]